MIKSDPSEFLFLPGYQYLHKLDLSATSFRIEPNTFESIAEEMKILFLWRIGLTYSIYLPMAKMTQLKNLDLSENPLDWSVFSCPFFQSHPKLIELCFSNTLLVDMDSLGLRDLFN